MFFKPSWILNNNDFLMWLCDYIVIVKYGVFDCIRNEHGLNYSQAQTRAATGKAIFINYPPIRAAWQARPDAHVGNLNFNGQFVNKLFLFVPERWPRPAASEGGACHASPVSRQAPGVTLPDSGSGHQPPWLLTWEGLKGTCQPWASPGSRAWQLSWLVAAVWGSRDGGVLPSSPGAGRAPMLPRSEVPPSLPPLGTFKALSPAGSAQRPRRLWLGAAHPVSDPRGMPWEPGLCWAPRGTQKWARAMRNVSLQSLQPPGGRGGWTHWRAHPDPQARASPPLEACPAQEGGLLRGGAGQSPVQSQALG